MIQIDPGFQPRALADEYQISRPIVGQLARLFGARALPNMERQGLSVMDATRRALDDTIAGVRAGENLLFYPSGRLRQQYREEIRAASGTEILAKALPEARFVLVRITGLWGSSYSLAFDGTMPGVVATTLRGLKFLLLNAVFFMPRRHVLIEFEEPADFPRRESRMAINAYLEEFYNARAPRNTYVPYRFWEKGGAQERPDPQVHRPSGDAAQVPEGDTPDRHRRVDAADRAQRDVARRPTGPGPRPRQPGSGGTRALDREGVRIPGRHAREPRDRRRRRPGGVGQGHLGDRVGAEACQPGVARRRRRPGAGHSPRRRPSPRSSWHRPRAVRAS